MLASPSFWPEGFWLDEHWPERYWPEPVVTVTTSSSDVSRDACEALRDVQQVANDFGTPVTIRQRVEADVSRGALGAVKIRSIVPTMTVYAYPVDRSPDKRALEKAGLRDEAECVIYTPMKSWSDAGAIDLGNLGPSIAALDVTRTTVIMDGTEWKVSDKGLAGRVGSTPLHVTLGLRRN